MLRNRTVLLKFNVYKIFLHNNSIQIAAIRVSCSHNYRYFSTSGSPASIFQNSSPLQEAKNFRSNSFGTDSANVKEFPT